MALADTVPEVHLTSYPSFASKIELEHPAGRRLLDELLEATGDLPSETSAGSISRGLSTSRKILIKSAGKFPYVVKLDSSNSIQRELNGDRLIRPRVPSLSIPDLAFSKIDGDAGILAYRYVTKGRIFDPPQRLDAWAETASKSDLVTAIDSLYEIVLKKLHWSDGDVRSEKISAPKLKFQATWENEDAHRILSDYEEVLKVSGVDSFGRIDCPVGGVHGDLHAKNILVDSPQRLILLDFDKVEMDAPIVKDYVRLDLYLPLAALIRRTDPLTAMGMPRPHYKEYDPMSFMQVVTRLYRGSELEYPRSSRPLASAVHEIRSSFWRGCMSNTVKMTPESTRNVYRVFLAFEMAKYLLNRIGQKGIRDELSFTLVSNAFSSLAK